MLQGSTILEETENDMLLRVPKTSIAQQAPTQEQPEVQTEEMVTERVPAQQRQVISSDEPLQIGGVFKGTPLEGVGYRGPLRADEPTRQDIEAEEEAKSQKAAKTYREGARQEAAAEKAIAESKIAATEAEAAGSLALAQQQEALTDEFLAERAKRQGMLNDFYKDISNSIDTGKVNPNRFWQNKSGLQKVGMVLGTFLAGIGRGENQVMRMINQQIENDVRAQYLDFKQRGARSNNLFAQLRRKLGNDDQAALMAMKAQMATAKAQLGVFLNRSKSPQTAAQAAKAVGLINQKMAEFDNKLRETSSKLAEKKIGRGIDPGALGKKITSAQLLKGDVGRFIGTGKKDEKGNEIGYLIGGSQKEATQLRDVVKQTKLAAQRIDIILGAIKKYGREALPTEAKARAATMAKRLYSSLKTIDELGVLQQADIEWLKETVSDNPLEVWQLNNKVRLETLRKDIISDLGLRLESLSVPKDPALMPKKIDSSSFQEWQKKFGKKRK